MARREISKVAKSAKVAKLAKLAKTSEPPASDVAPAPTDLTPVVATNLRRYRSERGLSLEALSKRSGVSRTMLGQIETSKSAPTINVLWKIARALDLPFSALITADAPRSSWVLPLAKARVLTSSDQRFSSRALFPMDRPHHVEFYELRLRPGAFEQADPHALGTTENLVVVSGRVALEVDGDRRLLAPGDAMFFEADVPHSYENIDPKNDAVMYLVMTYVRSESS